MQQHYKTLNVTAVGAQERQSPLAIAVGEANNSLDIAFEHLATLKERFALALLPVGIGSDGNMADEAPKRVVSPAVGAVEELSARINCLVNSLADINSRVGV